MFLPLLDEVLKLGFSRRHMLQVAVLIWAALLLKYGRTPWQLWRNVKSRQELLNKVMAILRRGSWVSSVSR